MKEYTLQYCLGVALLVAGIFVEPELWGIKLAVLLAGSVLICLSAIQEYFDCKEKEEAEQEKKAKENRRDYSADFEKLYNEILIDEIMQPEKETKKEQLGEAAQVLLLQENYNNDIVTETMPDVKEEIAS